MLRSSTIKPLRLASTRSSRSGKRITGPAPRTANRQQLAYTILVELLAYQFASPVRWIETQDLLFTSFKFERLVELGPSPTLTGMATRTLKAKYETLDGSISRTRAILCHSKNVKEIYYQYEDEVEAPLAESASDAAPLAAATAASPAAPVAPTGPVASIEVLDLLAPMVSSFSPPLSNLPSASHLKLRPRPGSTVSSPFTLSGQEYRSLPRVLQVLVAVAVVAL